MVIQYNGIAIAGTGAPVALSAIPMLVNEVVISGTALVTLRDANGVIMATINANTPFRLPGTGYREWGEQSQIDLSQYTLSVPLLQTAHIAFTVKQ